MLGVGAHYQNLPEQADEYLNKVIAAEVKEDDEDENAFNRRRANAYYYLAIEEANFGDLGARPA